MNMLFVIAFLAAPLYVWRFQISGIDMNALLVCAGLVIAVGVGGIFISGKAKEFYQSIIALPKILLGSIGLVLVASVISLFVGGIDVPKIGQWIVLYVQPMLMYLLLRFYTLQNPALRSDTIRAGYLLVGLAGAVAILQFFTLATLPPDWWGNSAEPKRAISFFAHPNAFALFVTPLLAYLIPDVWQRISKAWINWMKADSIYILLWVIGGAGLFVSLSRGGWLALAGAVALFALLSRNKKLILSLLVLAVIVGGIIAATPVLRYRVTLPFQGEKSAVARLSLWDTAGKMISDSPVLGKGIHGFNYNWEKYNTDPNLDHYNFPHNILFNTWIDTGILGVMGFLGILGLALWQGVKRSARKHQLMFALFAASMIIHGLIDIPYFKNDLALAFWMLLALNE